MELFIFVYWDDFGWSWNVTCFKVSIVGTLTSFDTWPQVWSPPALLPGKAYTKFGPRMTLILRWPRMALKSDLKICAKIVGTLTSSHVRSLVPVRHSCKFDLEMTSDDLDIYDKISSTLTSPHVPTLVPVGHSIKSFPIWPWTTRITKIGKDIHKWKSMNVIKMISIDL